MNMLITFTKAMMDFFGRKPGQSVGEFAAELKALTDADREFFKSEFARLGWTVQG
jgi:hypothetical protein